MSSQALVPPRRTMKQTMEIIGKIVKQLKNDIAQARADQYTLFFAPVYRGNSKAFLIGYGRMIQEHKRLEQQVMELEKIMDMLKI